MFLCAFAALPHSAAAQATMDPYESARFQFGPLRLTPALQITSLGRDSNIFNEAEEPKADTQAAIGPSVQFWLRPAGTRLSGRVGAQYLYFREYHNQRAWNTSNDGKWEVPLSRFTPFIEGSYVNSKERMGYEIDSRSRRRDAAVGVGTSFRVAGNTSLIVSFRRFDAKYDETESLEALQLARALNRREDRTKAELRYALTPLTTFVVEGEAGRDRFTKTNLRDADTFKLMSGFQIKPLALVSGRVYVGYRQFQPLTSTLPDYRGLAVKVDAAYISRGSTRFQVKVDRDVQYSFEPTRPYYALLDAGLEVTQRVGPTWEVLARGSHQRLNYRLIGSSEKPANTPGDTGYVYGAGIGYRPAPALRLGVDANYYTRKSDFVGRREYEGLRVFGSITYGILQ
ncbi:hypothetical protein BH18ACI5_BH18ACI5_16220 [soil metagenome]